MHYSCYISHAVETTNAKIFVTDGSGKFRPLLYSCSGYGRTFSASCSHVIGEVSIISKVYMKYCI